MGGNGNIFGVFSCCPVGRSTFLIGHRDGVGFLDFWVSGLPRSEHFDLRSVEQFAVAKQHGPVFPG